MDSTKLLHVSISLINELNGGKPNSFLCVMNIIKNQMYMIIWLLIYIFIFIGTNFYIYCLRVGYTSYEEARWWNEI